MQRGVRAPVRKEQGGERAGEAEGVEKLPRRPPAAQRVQEHRVHREAAQMQREPAYIVFPGQQEQQRAQQLNPERGAGRGEAQPFPPRRIRAPIARAERSPGRRADGQPRGVAGREQAEARAVRRYGGQIEKTKARVHIITVFYALFRTLFPLHYSSSVPDGAKNLEAFFAFMWYT